MNPLSSATHPACHVALPEDIAAAITEVMAAARPGPRHHGADLAADLRPLCAAAGLVLALDEAGFDVWHTAMPEDADFALWHDPVPDGAKPWLRATYALTVGHRSGSVWRHQPRRTVVLPFDGPDSGAVAQHLAWGQLLAGLFMLPAAPPRDGGAAFTLPPSSS
jgi:hypothetical protein